MHGGYNLVSLTQLTKVGAITAFTRCDIDHLYATSCCYCYKLHPVN